MHLLQPQEVEVFYILPAIRRELSIALKSHGKTQKDIAKLLGVTPSAVSQYMHEKRATTTFPIELQDMINKAASKITDQQSMIREVQHILASAKKTKLICKIHEQLTDVPHGCDVCFPEANI